MYKWKIDAITGLMCAYAAMDDLKPLTPKPFTKDDLKDGMVVTLRNKKDYIVFKDCLINEVITISITDYERDIDYLKKEEDSYDIMQVKTLDGEILFNREEKKQYKIQYNCGKGIKTGNSMSLEEVKEQLDILDRDSFQSLIVEVTND